MDAGADSGGGDGGPDGPLELRLLPPADRVGVAGDALPDDCIVQAFRGKFPAESVNITFEVVAGGGRADPLVVTTDISGAAATRWTLGFGGPGQVLRASLEGADPVEFTADPTPREIAFAPAANYLAGNGPTDVRAAQVDDDAALDLVVAAHTDDALAVLHNLGDGAFGVADLFDSAGDNRTLTVARIDGDDLVDAISVGRSSDRVGIHLQAAGGLPMLAELPAGNGPFEAVAADFDGDGALDVAVSDSAADLVSVLLGDGTGVFEDAVPYAIGLRPQGIDAALLDGDDVLDIVVAQGAQAAPGTTDDTVGVLLGEGDGTFAAFESYLAEANPFDVALGDADGDGEVDAIVANATSQSISFLHGRGDGAFDVPVHFPLVGAPGLLTLADINGDGHLDVVVAIPIEDAVQILRNDGDGGFAVATTIPVGNTPRGVAVADVSGDGMPDVISANELSDDVSVLIRE